jgi:hypothetical protein
MVKAYQVDSQIKRTVELLGNGVAVEKSLVSKQNPAGLMVTTSLCTE